MVEVRAGGEGSLVSPEDTAAVTALRGEALATSTLRESASIASSRRVDERETEWGAYSLIDASGLWEGEEAAERVGEEAGEETAVFAEGHSIG